MLKDFKKKKNKSRKWIAILIVLAVLAIGCTVVLGVFNIRKITIEGVEHYTEEEIKNIIFKSTYDYNTLYLYWKFHYTEMEEIPFVDTLELELIAPDEVKLTVYEKSVIGYVEHLGRYLYFDKDGMVVESSETMIEGVPAISGLNFDHIVLNEQLPVEKEEVFRDILDISQLLSKYKIVPDKIYFGDTLEVTLYFGYAKVYLGDDTDIEEKIVRLQYLLPSLEGLKGTLHMENFTEDTENITFEKEE